MMYIASTAFFKTLSSFIKYKSHQIFRSSDSRNLWQLMQICVANLFNKLSIKSRRASLNPNQFNYGLRSSLMEFLELHLSYFKEESISNEIPVSYKLYSISCKSDLKFQHLMW